MSVATLDIKINSAYKQSENLYKREQSWQEQIDSLLDRMNALNGFLDSYRELLLKLTFEIERDMDGFRNSQNAPIIIKKLVAVSIKALNRIQKSDLYPGVKTTFHKLRQEISYLNELVHDRKVSIELMNDEEMDEIIQTTLTAANRK
jgi:hypothetical protein